MKPARTLLAALLFATLAALPAADAPASPTALVTIHSETPGAGFEHCLANSS